MTRGRQTWTRGGEVEAPLLDAEAVARLLPHRPPLLLVEAVVAIRDEPPPALWAFRHITGQEPALAGHFPDDPIWPGALTLEGLAQAAGLLSGMLGGAPGTTRVLAAADVKFTAPVRPRVRLDYRVSRTHVIGRLQRFEAEAEVEGQVVATGHLTLAQVDGGP